MPVELKVRFRPFSLIYIGRRDKLGGGERQGVNMLDDPTLEIDYIQAIGTRVFPIFFIYFYLFLGPIGGFSNEGLGCSNVFSFRKKTNEGGVVENSPFSLIGVAMTDCHG